MISISCGGNGGDSVGEPNNNIMQANIPSWEKPINMKIDSVGDVDWFGLPVEGQGYVSVQARQIPDEIGLRVRFAHRQPWESTKHQWVNDWRELPTAVPVSATDTLFFAMQDDWNDEASDESVEIRAQFIPEFDKQEPNNSLGQATEMETGESNNAYIYPNGDHDYFKVQVDKQGYLVARANKVPEDLNLRVKYLTYDEWTDETEQLRDFGELPYGLFIAEAGEYYLQLIDDWDDASSQDPIQWKVDILPEMDRHEPNNSMETATPFAIGDTLHPAIFPVNDQDYFKVTPAANTTLQIRATELQDIVPVMRLYEKQDMDYKEVEDWKELPTTFELDGGTTYLLQMQDDWNDARRPEEFMIMTREGSGS
ncbi:MAG: hypothetical protein U5K72_08345 [Balneolaceae bacterium]|nr:hypothetical protein [Balneolaceae bacterium]